MHTSFISTTRVNNKWQVIETNLINLTTTPVPHEDYDDEYTAKIAGTILAGTIGFDVNTSWVQLFLYASYLAIVLRLYTKSTPTKTLVK